MTLGEHTQFLPHAQLQSPESGCVVMVFRGSSWDGIGSILKGKGPFIISTGGGAGSYQQNISQKHMTPLCQN